VHPAPTPANKSIRVRYLFARPPIAIANCGDRVGRATGAGKVEQLGSDET
jgi:hypothetical protein